MLIEVTHATHFSYDDDVVESSMEARLEPRNDDDQRVIGTSLKVQPVTKVSPFRDGFGNTVHCFNVQAPHRTLTVTSRSRVETLRSNPFALPERPPAAPDAVDCWPYLQFFGPVCRADEVATLADRFRPATPEATMDALQGLMRFINQTFEYQPEVTTVSSTVADLLALRRGVCQDFAHLMIAVCRTMAIPARYVSGYILSSAERAARGGGASHAWCEALVPGLGWRGFDPTNAVLAADSHIKVGLGRAYPDVPPTRGIYRGLADEHIQVTVRTVLVD